MGKTSDYDLKANTESSRLIAQSIDFLKAIKGRPIVAFEELAVDDQMS